MCALGLEYITVLYINRDLLGGFALSRGMFPGSYSSTHQPFSTQAAGWPSLALADVAGASLPTHLCASISLGRLASLTSLVIAKLLSKVVVWMIVLKYKLDHVTSLLKPLK